MILRWLHRSYRVVQSLSRWARRRFTPAGIFVLVGLLLAGMVANSEPSMGFEVFLLLGALLTVAISWAPFFRLRFAVERHTPRFVTAGDPFSLRVRVSNHSGRIQRGLEYFEDLRELPLTLSEFAARLNPGRGNRSFRVDDPLPPIRSATARPVLLPDLPARGQVEVKLELTAWRRGPLVLAGAIVARADPFGLFRGFSRFSSPQTVLVLPRRYPLPPLSLPGQSHYQRGGVAMAAGVGETEEFVALREYRRGDSLRRVHWRSAARLGELVVREYQDEYLVRHALVLDTFCEASRDALFEEAVAVAASFACTVPDQDSLLDLLFVGPQMVSVTSGRGVGHAQQMLEVLAAVKPNREPRFVELEALLQQHRVALSGCILVLLDWDAPRRALVRRLKASKLPCWVLLMAPAGSAEDFDPGPPEDRPDQLLVLEAGQVRAGLQRLGALR